MASVCVRLVQCMLYMYIHNFQTVEPLVSLRSDSSSTNLQVPWHLWSVLLIAIPVLVRCDGTAIPLAYVYRNCWRAVLARNLLMARSSRWG